jgi:hypothetical protein
VREARCRGRTTLGRLEGAGQRRGAVAQPGDGPVARRPCASLYTEPPILCGSCLTLIALGILISLLLISGLLLYAAGWVGLWIEAFRQKILWGLLVFLIPPVTVAFAFRHWRTARNPTLCLLIGVGLLALGYLLIFALGIRIRDN